MLDTLILFKILHEQENFSTYRLMIYYSQNLSICIIQKRKLIHTKNV